MRQHIQARTKEGAELADFMLDVLRGTGQFAGARVPLEVRIAAATWLADRGFGKPVQSTELSGPEGSPLEYANRGRADLRALSDDELDQLIRLTEKVQPADGGSV